MNCCDCSNWMTRTLRSSLGRKYLVALTGLAMSGFLIAHLSGNLLIFAGPEAMSAYAKGLRTFPTVLWGLRIGLIVAAVVHIVLAIQLNIQNRQARPVPYARKKFEAATWSSRQMVVTGILLLAYILYHLAHLTWRLTDPAFASLGEYDVYPMLVMSFSNLPVALTYIAAMVLMGLHLCHGLSSLFQTLGLNHPKYNPLLRMIGPVVATLLAAGFISIPVSVMLGIVK